MTTTEQIKLLREALQKCQDAIEAVDSAKIKNKSQWRLAFANGALDAVATALAVTEVTSVASGQDADWNAINHALRVCMVSANSEARVQTLSAAFVALDRLRNAAPVLQSPKRGEQS